MPELINFDATAAAEAKLAAEAKEEEALSAQDLAEAVEDEKIAVANAEKAAMAVVAHERRANVLASIAGAFEGDLDCIRQVFNTRSKRARAEAQHAAASAEVDLLKSVSRGASRNAQSDAIWANCLSEKVQADASREKTWERFMDSWKTESRAQIGCPPPSCATAARERALKRRALWSVYSRSLVFASSCPALP